MEYLDKVLYFLTDWVRPHLFEIAFAMIATLLIIYGDNLTSFLKGQTESLNFFVRLTVFVAFCAFGFTLISNYLTPLLRDLLLETDKWLGLVVIGTFYAIGLLANRKGVM